MSDILPPPTEAPDEHHTVLLPVLPLRDVVVFPGMIVPLFVGRKKSIQALEAVENDEKKLLLVSQKDAAIEDPESDQLYRTGVIATILQILRLPDGTVKVLVEANARASILYYVDNPQYLEAEAEILDETRQVPAKERQEITALGRSLMESFERYASLNKRVPAETVNNLKTLEQPERLVDMIISHLPIKLQEKQELLETTSPAERIEQVLSILEREAGLLTTEKRIRSRVRKQMEKSQKEYYLNEQMKAIQRELNEGEEGADELSKLEESIEKTRLSKEAKEKAQTELKKLRMMSPMSAEATVVRNYLDWLLAVPWKKPSKLSHNIARAKEVLEEDHYGLEKVKERILEYLAVQQRTRSLKVNAPSPILCFVGPPGVGKTSLARSIARATGRKFVRLSLGGVRDESEIRGHRRTYIGALPGKIMQSMKKAKKSNPLFLLDEIDKMGMDFRGDPAAALLEVLDPEQNRTFNDHYMEVDYDLSDVMFITTANTMNMPGPLLDRMEIIRISGYTEEEKIHIARRHLIEKQTRDNGLKKSEWTISDGALHELIARYTRESGVRNLERELAKLARKAVTKIVQKMVKKVSFTASNLKQYAGVPRFDYSVAEEDNRIGVTTGLAYTQTGGDLLPIEAVLIPGGKGRITLTGQLGEVMQESAQAAWSYVRSRAHDFGLRKADYHQRDIHIHVPEGAIPKDGPSAGAAICTTIVSAFTGVPVKRTVAMTGEISLRGRVMPIGGLKEKLLAALRGNIKTVLIPEKNVKDLQEIPANVKKQLEIIPVTTVDEVLSHTLSGTLTPLPFEEVEKDLALATEPKTGEELLTH